MFVHGVGTFIDITQEARDHGILRVAPEKKAWLSSQRVVGSLVRYSKRSFKIGLFDSSRLHGLKSSASSFRTEHDL